jgi:aldose 1-epimerase
MDVVELIAHGSGLRLVPAAGGAVTRYWRERAPVRDWLRPVSVEALGRGDRYETAAFPLVPYSNRIREGRFFFRGRAVTLPLNRPPERHSIHGHGWQRAWRTVETSADAVLLEYRHPVDAWPWTYRATQRFTLTPAALRIELTLASEGDGPMPAGLGWHPYFPRTPRTTITADVRAMWSTDGEMMPTALAAGPPVAALARGVTADALGLDNCFTGWSGRAVIEWPELGAGLTMTAEAPLGFVVVYTPAGRPYFCVEPVSHMTDAFNQAAAGRADSGMRVLAPGESLSAVVTLTPAG